MEKPTKRGNSGKTLTSTLIGPPPGLALAPSPYPWVGSPPSPPPLDFRQNLMTARTAVAVGPSTSWRSHLTASLSSSSCGRCSSSYAQASAARHACSLWACSVATWASSSAYRWASSLAHRRACSASCSSHSTIVICTSRKSCTFLSSWAEGMVVVVRRRERNFLSPSVYSAPAIYPIDSPNSAMRDLAGLDLELGYCYTPCNTALEF